MANPAYSRAHFEIGIEICDLVSDGGAFGDGCGGCANCMHDEHPKRRRCSDLILNFARVLLLCDLLLKSWI